MLLQSGTGELGEERDLEKTKISGSIHAQCYDNMGVFSNVLKLN